MKSKAKSDSSIFSLLIFLIGAIFLTSCGCQPRDDVSEECIQKEGKATIDGQSIKFSDWSSRDCSLSLKPLEARTVKLSTWGLLIKYNNNNAINRAYTVPPNTEVRVPSLSSFFAGYSTEEGAKSAFCRANRGAKEPTRWP